MGNFDKSGTELTAEGQFYVQLSAGTTNVKAAPGRIAKIIPVSGTGTVTIYDNALGNTSGNVIWPATAVAVGTPQFVGCPTNLGISVVVGATTTINLVYT